MIRACSMTGQPIRTSLKVGEWGPTWLPMA